MKMSIQITSAGGCVVAFHDDTTHAVIAEGAGYDLRTALHRAIARAQAARSLSDEETANLDLCTVIPRPPRHN